MRLRSRSALVILIIGVAAVAGAEYAWRRSAGAPKTQTPTEAAAPVTAATVVQKDVPVVLRALGTVQSIQSVNGADSGERSDHASVFKQGELVKAGDPLFLIDPRV